MNLVWLLLLIMIVCYIGVLQFEVVRDVFKVFKSSFYVILRYLELVNGYFYWEISYFLRVLFCYVVCFDVLDDVDVVSFRDNIVVDVERNWNVGEKRIGIKIFVKSIQLFIQIGQGVKVFE